MRIIFVTSSAFPYYAGGVETWMYNIIKRIADNNEVIVLSSADRSMDNQFPDMPENVRFVHFQGLYKRLLVKKLLRGRLSIYNQYSWRKDLQTKLVVLLKESTQIPYIFCVEPLFTGYSVLQLKRRGYDFYMVTSLRGPHLQVAVNSFPLHKKTLAKRERETIIGSDLVLANGWDTKDSYEEKYHIECIVQKNGVDIEKIHRSSIDEATEMNGNIACFVSVASLIPIKGVYKFVDAASVYKKKYGNDFMVYFVGKGNKNELLEYASKLGVKQNIRCLGNKQNPYPYMKKAKVNVCLSGGSGLSMSMLEAMATGVPVIALDTPVYRQFNKYNQLELVSDNNPEELADKMFEVITNYEKYCEMAQKSVIVAEEFDWSIVVNDFYNNLSMIKR